MLLDMDMHTVQHGDNGKAFLSGPAREGSRPALGSEGIGA